MTNKEKDIHKLDTEGHNSCNPCSSDLIPKDPKLGGGDPKAGSSDPSNWFSRAWDAFNDWVGDLNRDYIDGLSPERLEQRLLSGDISNRYLGYAVTKHISNLEEAFGAGGGGCKCC